MRDDHQLALVCETICRVAGLGELLWCPQGLASGEASDRAWRWYKRPPGWSHGESLMFQVAWAVWNGSKRPNLAEMLATFDGRNLELVGSLLCAMAAGTSHAIDVWLAKYEPPRIEADHGSR